MESIESAVERLERGQQQQADIDQIRMFVDYALAALRATDDRGDGHDGQSRIEEWAVDAAYAASQGEIVRAFRVYERFSDAPPPDGRDGEYHAGIWRFSYAGYTQGFAHADGEHGSEPDPNCVDCPNPRGRLTEHGSIRSYEAAVGERDARSCRSCGEAPPRLHVCLECGQQCWSCSSSQHTTQDEPVRVGPERRIAVFADNEAA